MSKYILHESVGKQFQRVRAYDDIEIHHPTANNVGVVSGKLEDLEKGRPHAKVEGDFEEIRKTRDGRTLVKKDLIFSQTTEGPIYIPAPVAGYVRYEKSYGAARIYDGPGQDARLLGTVLHMKPSTFTGKSGEYIQYGEPLGVQSDTAANGKSVNGDKIGIHAHVELEPPQFRKYIADIESGVIVPGKAVHADAPAVAGPAKEQVEGARTLQQSLTTLGYRDASGRALVVDGEAGPRTKEAVRAFQQAHGLEADGIAGPRTRAALDAALRAPTLSDATHPDHGLYAQALKGVEGLQRGGFDTPQARGNAAATLVYEARTSGLSRIDHVVANVQGTGVFAVQGELNDPMHRRVYVDREQAQRQPVAHSSEQLRTEQVALQAPVQEHAPQYRTMAMARQ